MYHRWPSYRTEHRPCHPSPRWLFLAHQKRWHRKDASLRHDRRCWSGHRFHHFEILLCTPKTGVRQKKKKKTQKTDFHSHFFLQRKKKNSDDSCSFHRKKNLKKQIFTVIFFVTEEKSSDLTHFLSGNQSFFTEENSDDSCSFKKKKKMVILSRLTSWVPRGVRRFSGAKFLVKTRFVGFFSFAVSS